MGLAKEKGSYRVQCVEDCLDNDILGSWRV